MELPALNGLSCPLTEVERPVADCPDPAGRIVVAFRTARDCGSTGPSSDGAAYRPGGVDQVIMVVPTDRIYLCCGEIDMRRGINSLARMAQQVLALDPHTGAIFCFRRRKGDIIKILEHDDQGFCLFTKRLSEGCFAWPTTKDQGLCRLSRQSFRCFWTGLTGAGRTRFIDRVWPAKFDRFSLIVCRLCFRRRGLSGM
ncbi:IS66 family insertion sequence element accessory protein TnpB [Mesorhizobium sp. M0698]|uniref:IS66 family insertion sequence element accessory protein TnpB n=1 Tax=Mesorhizobium sp. M0698 TaxID=2956987 RepID=UPI0033378099